MQDNRRNSNGSGVGAWLTSHPQQQHTSTRTHQQQQPAMWRRAILTSRTPLATRSIGLRASIAPLASLPTPLPHLVAVASPRQSLHSIKRQDNATSESNV